MTLIGYWPLNETSGSTAYDYSRRGNNGSIEGAEIGVPGILGTTSYDFNGNSYVDIPNSRELNPSNQVSVSAWVYINNNTDNNYIFDKRTPSSWDDAYIMWIQDASDDNYVSFTVGGVGSVQSNTAIKDPRWYHIAAAYDGEEMRIHIDNKIEDRISASGSITSNTRSLRLATRSDLSDEKMNGKMAEFRLYNHALTPQEIQYLYSVGKRGRQVTSAKNS